MYVMFTLFRFTGLYEGDLEERIHSERKISSIMGFTLLIMPIILISFCPLSVKVKSTPSLDLALGV